MTKEILRDEIKKYCSNNTPLIYISYKFGGKSYELTDFIKSLDTEDLMHQIEDYFAKIPFNNTDCWIGILAGEYASMLPVGFIDIFTCEEMEKSMIDRRYLRHWIETDFCIESHCKVATSSKYPYVLQHRRLTPNLLTPRLVLRRV